MLLNILGVSHCFLKMRGHLYATSQQGNGINFRSNSDISSCQYNVAEIKYLSGYGRSQKLYENGQLHDDDRYPLSNIGIHFAPATHVAENGTIATMYNKFSAQRVSDFATIVKYDENGDGSGANANVAEISVIDHYL